MTKTYTYKFNKRGRAYTPKSIWKSVAKGIVGIAMLGATFTGIKIIDNYTKQESKPQITISNEENNNYTGHQSIDNYVNDHVPVQKSTPKQVQEHIVTQKSVPTTEKKPNDSTVKKTYEAIQNVANDISSLVKDSPHSGLKIADKGFLEEYSQYTKTLKQKSEKEKLANKLMDIQTRLSEVSRYDDYFEKYGKQFKVDPNLMRATYATESSGRNRETSKTGAEGGGQIMPRTQKLLGMRNDSYRKDAFDPEKTIEGIAKHYRRLLNLFDGNVLKSIISYNYGDGFMKAFEDKFGSNWNSWKDHLNYMDFHRDKKTHKIWLTNKPFFKRPNNQESRDYPKKILSISDIAANPKDYGITIEQKPLRSQELATAIVEHIDSLENTFRIALKYNTTRKEILEFNNITSESLIAVGDSLYIPQSIINSRDRIKNLVAIKTSHKKSGHRNNKRSYANNQPYSSQKQYPPRTGMR